MLVTGTLMRIDDHELEEDGLRILHNPESVEFTVRVTGLPRVGQRTGTFRAVPKYVDGDWANWSMEVRSVNRWEGVGQVTLSTMLDAARAVFREFLSRRTPTVSPDKSPLLAMWERPSATRARPTRCTSWTAIGTN
jgi:hypothetical protein